MPESSKFIQVGFTALRDPATGGFLPAVPLYIEATSEAKAAEGAMIKDISRVLADKMKQYIESGGLIEKPATRRNARKAGR